MSGFDHQVGFMDTPGIRRYPQFNLDIVSPELPCGVSWLANCLLELGIPAWKAWNLNIAHHWQDIGQDQFCYKHPASDLQQTLPALKTGRCFNFRTTTVPRFSHNPVNLIDHNHPLIFVIRDPRDALYSQWRRQFPEQAVSASKFVDFLNSPYHHYPLSHLGFTRFYLSLCHELLKDQRHIIVRFEDFKRQPVESLSTILSYLDIHEEPHAIHQATQASEFEQFKAVGLKHLQNGISKRQLNRAGKVCEYREHFTPEMRQLVDPVLDDVLRWLKYESTEPQQSEMTSNSHDQRFLLRMQRAVQQQYGEKLPKSFLNAALSAAKNTPSGSCSQ